MEIRRLIMTDLPQIINISQKIWEGEDYLQYVAKDWLTEENSFFAGVFMENKLIAFGRLKYLTPHDAWLEGLRKDPACKIPGIAKLLNEFFLTKVKGQPESKTIRFSTYFQNMQSINSAKSQGFLVKQAFSFKECIVRPYGKYQAEVLPGNENSPSQELLKYLEKSSHLKGLNGFLPLNWVVYPYQRYLLENLIGNGNCLTVRHGKKLKGAVVYQRNKERHDYFLVAVRAETFSAFRSLVMRIKQMAKDDACYSVNIIIGKNKYLREMCDKVGLKSWEKENDFLLFDYPLDR